MVRNALLILYRLLQAHLMIRTSFSCFIAVYESYGIHAVAKKAPSADFSVANGCSRRSNIPLSYCRWGTARRKSIPESLFTPTHKACLVSGPSWGIYKTKARASVIQWKCEWDYLRKKMFHRFITAPTYLGQTNCVW